MEFLTNYGLFLAKTLTWVVAIIVVVTFVVAAGMKRNRPEKGQIQVTVLNEVFDERADAVKSYLLDDKALKEENKQRKKDEKQKKKNRDAPRKKRVYVLDFDGDIKASAAEELRHCVTAVLAHAQTQDEVLVRLESQGGMVHSYGFAASQLKRITAKHIPLTVCVDKVAASGGYMMACVAQKILAAPFAVVGSIGVVASLPNFHRVLKKHDVDYEMLTAGEYKRTLTVFGENTDKGRQKFQEDLDDTHGLFKDFIRENRPNLAVDAVATGEVWFGVRALEKGLIDGLATSDEYLTQLHPETDIFGIRFEVKKSLLERAGGQMGQALARAIESSVKPLMNRYWAQH